MSSSCTQSAAFRRRHLRFKLLSVEDVVAVISEQRAVFDLVLRLQWGDEAEDITSDAAELVLRQATGGKVFFSAEADVIRALLDAIHEVLMRRRASVDALDHARPFPAEEDTDEDED